MKKSLQHFNFANCSSPIYSLLNISNYVDGHPYTLYVYAVLSSPEVKTAGVKQKNPKGN